MGTLCGAIYGSSQVIGSYICDNYNYQDAGCTLNPVGYGQEFTRGKEVSREHYFKLVTVTPISDKPPLTYAHNGNLAILEVAGTDTITSPKSPPPQIVHHISKTSRNSSTIT